MDQHSDFRHKKIKIMSPFKSLSPILFSGLLALLLLCSAQAHAQPVQSVSQHGITWTFDRPVEAGRFVNGDWWVLGPVTVTEISPASVDGMHGSMLNPPIHRDVAFDRRIQRNTYNEEDNVALQLPLPIAKPASLLSSISLLEDRVRDNPQIDTIAVLTVLMERPPPGSLRPPYQGDDKSIPGNLADVNIDILRRLPPVEAAPTDLQALAKEF